MIKTQACHVENAILFSHPHTIYYNLPEEKKTLNIGPTSWPPDPYGGPIHRRACAWFNVAVKILLSINKIPCICILHKAPHIMQLVLLCSYVKHFGRMHAPFHTPGFCFTNVGAAAFARRMGAWCEFFFLKIYPPNILSQHNTSRHSFF